VLPGFNGNYDSIAQFTSLLLVNSFLVVSYTNSSMLEQQSINYNNDTLKNLVVSSKDRASNGVLYTVSNDISQIISPAFNSVVAVALQDKKYSMFLNLLTSRRVGANTNYFYTPNVDYLKNQNHKFTLIVPTNSAFSNAGIVWHNDYQGNPDFFLDKR
jgi:hypothetical protein